MRCFSRSKYSRVRLEFPHAKSPQDSLDKTESSWC
jgi:hypothetical protein